MRFGAAADICHRALGAFSHPSGPGNTGGGGARYDLGVADDAGKGIADDLAYGHVANQQAVIAINRRFDARGKGKWVGGAQQDRLGCQKRTGHIRTVRHS